MSAWGISREERWSTSGVGGLQRGLVCMTNTTTSSGRRVPGVDFCRQEGIVHYSVDKMASKLLLLTGASGSWRLKLHSSQRLFSRVQPSICKNFTLQWTNVHLQWLFSLSTPQLWYFWNLFGLAIYSMRGPSGKGAHVCATTYTLRHITFLFMTFLSGEKRLFPCSLAQLIQRIILME